MKSLRQVCSKSAADQPQTLHHTERVCGKYAASLRQTLHHTERVCGKSAASLRQKTNLHVKKMTVCCRSAASLPQEYAAGSFLSYGRYSTTKMIISSREAIILDGFQFRKIYSFVKNSNIIFPTKERF